MEEGPIQGVIQKFHERIDRGNLTDDTKIVYRVAGGFPHERIEEYCLSGSGTATLLRQDRLNSIPRQELSTTLDQTESRELFQQIRSGLASLIPQSQARFLPDSVVGSLTVEVDGERETFYFLPQEEDRVAQNKPIAPQIVEAGKHFREIAQRPQNRE